LEPHRRGVQSDTVPTTPAEASTPARRVTAGRVAATIIVLGVALIWIYALTRQPEPPPDLLDDTAFAPQAEQTCAATLQRLDQLPPAHDAAGPAERAAIVEQSNDELSTMLASLEQTIPTGERDQRMLREWVADWRTYLGNRDEYVDRLRTEGDARIYVAEKDGRQITVAIDRFAEVNEMPACRTPKDIS
jgi:hypothetical protein